MTSSDSWIRVSPSSGTASEEPISVTIKCDPNTTYDPRNTTITITVEELTEIISISQETNLGLIVSPKRYELSKQAQSIEIEVRSNVDYTVSIDESCKGWIIPTTTKALSTEKLSFHVAANDSYDSREGKIVFKQINGTLIETVSILQSQTDGLFLSQDSFELSYEEQTVQVDIQYNVAFEISIPSSAESWISYNESGTKALETKTIVFHVLENKTESDRSCSIVFTKTDGSLSSTLTIKQDRFIPVERVELNHSNLSLKVGETVVLTATIYPNNATDKTISWLSSDNTIAAVDEGFVSALKEGAVVISAKSGDAYGTCAITVKPKDISITGEVNNITESSAIVMGFALLESPEIESAEYGIEYSEKDLTTDAISIKASSLDNNGKYSLKLSNLRSSTTYYYRSYVLRNATRVYGEIKTFKTTDFDLSATTNDATVTNWNSALVYGSFSDSCIENVGRVFQFFFSDSYANLDDLVIKGEVVTASLSSTATFEGVLKNLRPSRKYYYVAMASIHDKIVYGEVKSFITDAFKIEAVDMGLPSGTKWANGNIGSKWPEDYGDYYAWGETKTKTDYSWSTYKWCMGTNKTYTKYSLSSGFGYNGFVDNKQALEKEDDVAYVILGEHWSTPSPDQMDELWARTNCDWQKTTQYGVEGYLVTSKKNGNSIFIPFGGGRKEGTEIYRPDGGDYMTSTCVSGSQQDQIHDYLFIPYCVISSGVRCYGYVVRAVYKE